MHPILFKKYGDLLSQVEFFCLVLEVGVAPSRKSLLCHLDGHFGLVLCNAMLELDKHFRKMLEEIYRVTKPGL